MRTKLLLVILIGSIAGCGDNGGVPSGAAPLDGVWESASSSVEIDNTCGIERAAEIVGGGIFPMEVKRRATAVEVIDGRGFATPGKVVGPDGFSVKFMPGLQVYLDPHEELNVAWIDERVIFSDVRAAEANYVHIIKLSSRSNGGPDCQITLSGVAMRVEKKPHEGEQ